MKKQFYISTILSLLVIQSYAQDPVNITFTSKFLSQSVHPEYITIANLTNGGDTTLFWPDTVLTMIPVSASGMTVAASEFKLFQNVPNPVFEGSGTSFKVFLPHKGTLQVKVTDVEGRTAASLSMSLDNGYSTFRLNPGKSKVYIVSAIFEGQIQSIKVVTASSGTNGNSKLQYLGTQSNGPVLKSTKGRSNFVYYTGDLLSITAKYLQFTITIIDVLSEDQLYNFKFSDILSGDDTKTWRLIRDVTTGRYPLQVGPADESNIWWALGLNEPLWVRICMFNDEWTFTSGGEMLFHTLGDFWAENGIFHPDIANTCQPSSNMYGPFNEDFSAWDDGVHLYSVSEDNVTVNGLGAYIGFIRTGTNMQVTVPQEQIIYSLEKLSDAATDTLILRCNYMAGETPAYWKYVLVHYDNPEDEPPMPVEQIPVPDFDLTSDGMTVYLTNTSLYANYFVWNFGDGQTSAETSPVHTYAVPGKYLITLTASNQMATAEASRYFLASEIVISNELLMGSSWKVSIDEQTIFVGPKLGSPDWWSVPLAEMLPGGSWSCLVNDEFEFSEGGNYEYRTNGDVRNDGYMGYPTGCMSDAELLAFSGYGSAFQSAVHSYNLYTGANPYIIFTNGSENTAAFIGFYKGYYGGENMDQYSPPNGGSSTNRYEVLGYADDGVKEYLLISVDLNGSQPGGAAWSYILERDSGKK